MPVRETTARDRRLLEFAEDHWGLIRHDDLVAAGLQRGAIQARIEASRLTEIHRCVYAWGHSALRDEGRWLAALWALGEDVALSHLTAAAYYRWRVPLRDEELHLSTTRWLRDRDDLRVHRVRRLDAPDLFRPRHLVVTSMPRTLVDLADLLPWGEYRALVDGLPDLPVRHIRAAHERAPFRVGSPKVRRLLDADDAHTKSEFERRFLRFARTFGLPRPSGLNVRVAGHKVDCLYGDERLVVELDGRACHRRRGQMRADRRRDSEYQLAGHLILRLVWDDLHPDEAPATADRLRAMLAAGRGRGL